MIKRTEKEASTETESRQERMLQITNREKNIHQNNPEFSPHSLKIGRNDKKCQQSMLKGFGENIYTNTLLVEL